MGYRPITPESSGGAASSEPLDVLPRPDRLECMFVCVCVMNCRAVLVNVCRVSVLRNPVGRKAPIDAHNSCKTVGTKWIMVHSKYLLESLSRIFLLKGLLDHILKYSLFFVNLDVHWRTLLSGESHVTQIFSNGVSVISLKHSPKFTFPSAKEIDGTDLFRAQQNILKNVF